MTADPLVSIVLPTHNGSRFLQESVRSCLGQTYQNLELVVIDDCSDYSVKDLLNPYDDPRLHVHRNCVNMGLPASLNKGFALARGTLFTWTSDDNVFYSNAIERMVHFLREHDADCVYAHQDIIDSHGCVVGRFNVQEPCDLLRANVVNACFLYRRVIHEAINGYDTSLSLLEDWDFFLRASLSFRLVPIDEVLYGYRIHDSSLSSTKKRERNFAMIRFIEKRLLPLSQSPVNRSSYYKHLYALYKSCGHTGLAYKNLIRSYLCRLALWK